VGRGAVMFKARDRSGFRKVHLRPEAKVCACCSGELSFKWNTDRYVVFLKERLHIDYHVYACWRKGCPLRGVGIRPEGLTVRVLPGYEYGLDVVAMIGYCRIKLALSFPRIASFLKDLHAVGISERRVEDLFNLYVALSTRDVCTDKGLRKKLKKQGRLVLSIDAAKPDMDGESLWLIRDQISGEVLLGFAAQRIDAKGLAAKIRSVASLGIPVVGAVSDGEPRIIEAVRLALPGKPHQLCQYHFLDDFAEEVTKLDGLLLKGLKGDLRGLSRFEDAAASGPTRSRRETEIAAPASLPVGG
jgi:hypothetical protein